MYIHYPYNKVEYLQIHIPRYTHIYYQGSQAHSLLEFSPYKRYNHLERSTNE